MSSYLIIGSKILIWSVDYSKDSETKYPWLSALYESNFICSFCYCMIKYVIEREEHNFWLEIIHK